MRKYRMISWLVTVFLCTALLVSGCSGGQEATGESGNKVQLKLGYYSSGGSEEKMRELIQKFMEKHPTIEITAESAPYNQFFQKLDTQISANNAPDVWLSDGVFVAKFAERGAVRDISDWVKRDLKQEDYYALEFNKDANGKYWGVPQGIQIAVLYYNKDKFDKAGLKYPDENWTWDDVKKAAEVLTLDSNGRNSKDPAFDAKSISQFGLRFFSITEGWMSVLKSFGGGVLDNTMQHSIINSPENKQALEWIVDGMKRNIFTDPADIKSFKSPVAPFPSGQAAMQIGIYARVLTANEAGVNFDVTVLPKGPSGKRFAPIIANSWVINSKASDEKAKAAWEWMKYWVTDDEVQKEWASLGEAVPVKKSVANSPLFLKTGKHPANKQAFLDSFSFAGRIDDNAVWSEWLSTFNDHLNRAFMGEITVDEVLPKAHQDVQQILDAFYKK